MSMKPGSFGTVGFLDISQQDRRIKAIKLGFDFEHNPVRFIVEVEGMDEAARRDRRLQPRSGEQLEQLKGIHYRSPFDTMAWNEIQDGVANGLKWHSGLWALKGDRLDVLNVRIPALATLQIIQGGFQNSLVWDLYLDNKNFEGNFLITRKFPRLKTYFDR